MTTRSGFTNLLISKGWKRTEVWDGEECGYIGTTGVCIKSARWVEPGYRSVHVVCAQHAKIMEESRPGWERTLIDQSRI